MKFRSTKKYAVGSDSCFGGNPGSGSVNRIIHTHATVINGQATSGDKKKVKGDKTIWIEFYFI
jgi:hypothetical protein